MPECPLEASEGVKAMDAAWVSNKRRASKPNDPAYLVAPEICVEILSPCNTTQEMEERKALFFERGAIEFWQCDESGRMKFFDAAGPISKSNLCPRFPTKVQLKAG